MRPLRCSMRLGFQGTSKWKRSAQWFWRLTPSRAASVAIRMRSGCFAGSALNARLTSSRASSRHAAVEGRDARVGLAAGRERRAKLLLEVALGVGVLGEDEHAARVLPGPRRSGASTRASGRPRAPSATLGHAARAASRSGAKGVGPPGATLAQRARAVAAAIAASSSSADVVFAGIRAVVVCVRRLGQQASSGRETRAAATSARCAACAAALRLRVERLPVHRAACEANASIEESSRFCRPQITRAAAVCTDFGASFSRSSRAWRYSSSSCGKQQLGAVRRQAVDRRPRRSRAPGSRPASFAQVVLEPADHHRLELLRALHRHAAAEALRVEDLEQRREAVRVAVVRRGRQEQPVLEARRQVAHGPRELRVDGVARAAGRGRVVRLVEDEQAAAARSRPASRAAATRSPRRAAGGATR